MDDRATRIAGDPSRLKYELERFRLGGPFDLYEDGLFLAAIAPEQARAEVSHNKLIFSYCGDGFARARRIVSLEATPHGLRLESQSAWGGGRRVIELRRGAPAVASAAARRQFAARLAALIEASFAGWRVERATAARDDTRHFSAAHARLLIRDGVRRIAATGVAPFEDQSTVDATLGAGLIWLDAARRRNAGIDRLLLMAPRGRASTLATRLTAIAVPGVAIRLFEVDEEDARIEPVAAFDQGSLSDYLRRSAKRARWPREAAMIPEPVSEAVEARSDSPTSRAQAERWLETLLRRDPTRLDPLLEREPVYAQVPAYRGERRGFIDLLARTRGGRLVILEVKVAEDVEFPLQALDYWLRVEWHRRRGDFERRGYFPGQPIAEAAPLVYLVAPLFRFHAMTKLIAGAIAGRVPVYRVGINEDWGLGLRVLVHERLNGH